MITPKFQLKDVATDGSAILIEDKTGVSSLYPNTGYGSPNMLYSDFTRFYAIVNQYDTSGAKKAEMTALYGPPTEQIITGTFGDGVYNLHVRLGARSTASVSRSGAETHRMVIPGTPTGISQVDRNFTHISDDSLPTPIVYKVANISGSIVTLETPAPNIITTPVYWYSMDKSFLIDQETMTALANFAACNCECSPHLITAYSSLIQARLLITSDDPYKAYQRFMYAKNIISAL